MSYFEFEYKGGVNQIGNDSCCKFLAFHIFHGKEIPFWEAKKTGIVSRPQVSGRNSNPKNLYCVETPIIKIFLYDLDFGRCKITQSFYLQMGNLDLPQTVEIKPTSKAGVKSEFYFKAKAKFLKKSEVLNLLDPSSQSYKMLQAQSPIPIDTLRSIITISRPKVLEQARKVRKLRIG